MVALIFISFGIGFRVRSGASISACIFADSACSNAFSTWTLVGITSLAFIAAAHAALKAGQALAVSQGALRLEMAEILGQWLCTHDSPKASRTRIFIEDSVITEGSPVSRRLDEFEPIHFDFENLGRSALLDVTVELIARYRGRDEEKRRIRIGNIGVDKEAHVSIYLIWDTPSRPLIGWSSEALLHNRRRLEYQPVDFIEAQATVEQAGPLQWRLPFRNRTHEPKRMWRLTFVTAQSSEKKKDGTGDEVKQRTG